MRRRLTLALMLCVPAAVPVAASAQSGVHVDPESPAGKEYAVPIDKARQEALGGNQPGSAGGGASGGSAKAFGEGIKRANGGAGGKGGSGSSGRSADGQRGSRGGDGLPVADAGAGTRLSTAAGADSGSGLASTGLIALAVLLGAGGIGFLLRRALRSS